MSIHAKASAAKRLRSNASAVSDAPHSKKAGRFGTLCGARPIQLFEGSRFAGRHLCKLNGVGVMRKASGRGRGVKNREERIGVLVVCVGLGQELEARFEMGSWFWGKKGARRRQVVRGTG